MIIAPGVNVPSVADMVELARTNSKRFVDITVQDVDGTPLDIIEETLASGQAKGELDLEVTDLAGNTILEQTYYPVQNPPDTRIIKVSTGKYKINYGTGDNETSDPGTYLFNWHARVDLDTEDIYRTQVMVVVSPRVLSLLPPFRLMIDKTVKPNLPEEMCFLGYTDSQLIMYLAQGLAHINSRPPYPTWTKMEDFPIELHSNLLIKAAMYEGLISQSLFAVDTDVPSYSDQGHSFVLAHFQGLNQVAQQLRQELDKVVPEMKRKYLASGTVSVEARMDWAYSMLLTSAPQGALFKNLYAAY